MTVSEYIFNYIAERGCQTVYMVSGSSAMWLSDALCRNNQLQAVCCHHEQAAAMAADGYGRVNGILGICLVTIGPGATNAVTGVAQAYLDSSPMIVLSGQANSHLLEYEKETKIRQHGTQSLNLEPMVGSITKYFAEVMKPEDIRYHMERAYFEAMDGRKGPVWIDVPVDVQNMQVPEQMIGYEPEEDSIQACYKYVNYSSSDNAVIFRVIDMLCNAEKPLILAGYGIRSAGACRELLQLIEMLNIPVVTSRGGIDVIGSEHSLYIGRPGSYGDRASHFAIQDCDGLLILGSRLSVSTIGYYPKQLAGNALKIMVDIDDKELAKEDVPVDIKIHADLKVFMSALLQELLHQGIKKQHQDWVRRCHDWKEKYPVVQSGYASETPLNEYYFTKLLSEETSGNANVIVDTGSVCNIVSQTWIIKENQRYLISGGLSCMGFWATSIGAVQEGRQTIAITGDGSAQMNIQELATLQYNKLPIKLFVYNNNGYMLIRHNQHNYMNDRFIGVGPDSGLRTPDFYKVADAYGLKSIRIVKGDNIQDRIRQVLEAEEPVLCEVMVQEFAPIIPRIASKVMPDGSLKAADFDDLYPFLDNKDKELI